jgi:hypothetical protein
MYTYVSYSIIYSHNHSLSQLYVHHTFLSCIQYNGLMRYIYIAQYPLSPLSILYK